MGGVRVVEASSVTTGARATTDGGKGCSASRAGFGPFSPAAPGVVPGRGRFSRSRQCPGARVPDRGGGVPGAFVTGRVRVLGRASSSRRRRSKSSPGRGSRPRGWCTGSSRAGERVTPTGAAIRSAHLAYGRRNSPTPGDRARVGRVRLEADAVDVWIDPERKGIGRAEDAAGYGSRTRGGWVGGTRPNGSRRRDGLSSWAARPLSTTRSGGAPRPVD